METSFKSLTEEDKELISNFYHKNIQTKEGKPLMSMEEIQDHLSDHFKVTTRTIRNWAKNLNLHNTHASYTPAKILCFDIETAPMEVRTFRTWGVDITPNMILRDWFMICWSAKWLFDDKVYSMRQTKKEVLAGDDERITKGLWEMVNEADMVVAHNLDKFDKKKMNTCFIKHGLNLPSPYQSIDTLKHLRKTFAITHNRLDFVAERFFGIQGKMKNPPGLWDRCVEGSVDDLRQMSLYCDQDVRVLEEVYLRIRPYMQPHPNVGLFIGGDVEVCATCGSDELDWGGEYHTSLNVYQAYRCECGALGRSRKSSLSVKDKKHLTASNPR
mgnify:CR=1 FL=1|tara:strand:- start:60228 stop:61211 length:984 start_codon:yes stop_codon:yes gene_type:complete